MRGIEREDAALPDRTQVAALHPALRLRVLAVACKRQPEEKTPASSDCRRDSLHRRIGR